MADLVDLDIVDFDINLGMDWLNASYVSINFITWVVKFQFPNEPVLEWMSSWVVTKCYLIPYLKRRNFFS